MRLIGAGTVEEKVYEKQVYKDGLRRTLTTATQRGKQGGEVELDGSEGEDGEDGGSDEDDVVVVDGNEDEGGDEREGQWQSRAKPTAQRRGGGGGSARQLTNAKQTEAHRYFTRDELRKLFVLGTNKVLMNYTSSNQEQLCAHHPETVHRSNGEILSSTLTSTLTSSLT